MCKKNNNNLFLSFIKKFLYVNNFENENCEKNFDWYELKRNLKIKIDVDEMISMLLSILKSKLSNWLRNVID